MCGLAPSPLWGEGWGEGPLALALLAVDCLLCGSACSCWPGYAPGGAPPFLVRTRKGGKRKRPHVCDPCASLRGKPASQRLRGARWNSLRSLRSLRSNTPREPVDEARACCAARATPKAPRRRRSLQGVENPFGPSLRSAPPTAKPGAERSDGPCWGSTPLWPCREAQGVGRAWAAQHAHASWTDLLRLFERSERSERSEFRSTAPRASIAGCPQRSEGTRPVGSPFFCLLFFGEAKKSRCAAGRTSRPASACSTDSKSNFSKLLQRCSPSPQPSPQRGEGQDRTEVLRNLP